jgi:hypothetical protein
MGALTVVAMTFAASTVAGEERGAEMLRALRDRDPAAHWEATRAAGRVTLPPEPQPVPPVVAPPVVEPVFPMPTAEEEADWRARRATVAAGAAERSTESGTARAAEPVARQEEPYGFMLPPEPRPIGDPSNGPARPVARTPDQLRSIREILPYHDYQPDPTIDDPCLYLCPRPDGLPCKEYAEGEFVPPCPEEISLGEEPFVPRVMPPSVFAWTASNVTYNPLYFEDPQLERYGHSYGDCIQPFVSVGRFGVQLLGLPYQMALDPPHKEVYPLGYYRPGEPAPRLFYQVPLNARAAAVTAGFYTGLGVILP